MKQVRSLKHLRLLAIQRKSVVCPSLKPWKKPRPAAFMINLQGTVLHRCLEGGMYVYNKGEK
jgi:hypothetical protein